MGIIETRGIEKIYRTGKISVPALCGVSISIGEGEFVSIMGPSGSGKSTLMNIFGCIDWATKGSYLLRGRDIRTRRPGELAELRNAHIGFVFQSFNFIPAPALQNVELPLIYRGVPGRERRRLAEAALAAVGLQDRTRHLPAELSGGQQQRVAIARAMVGEPAVLLADEPTGNLDSRTGGEIMDLFERLNRERGITIVMVTHDPFMARRARRIIRLRDGLVESDERVE